MKFQKVSRIDGTFLKEHKNTIMPPFFLMVAKPLLSVRITGSMTVERVAKPLKNSVLTKERNKTGLGKTEMLLRAGLNLRFLQDSKEKIRNNSSGH